MSLSWLQMSLVRIITQNKPIKPRLWFLKSPRYFFFDKLCFVFASLPLNRALSSVFLSSKVNIKQMSKAQTFNTTLFNFRQKTDSFVLVAEANNFLLLLLLYTSKMPSRIFGGLPEFFCQASKSFVSLQLSFVGSSYFAKPDRLKFL